MRNQLWVWIMVMASVGLTSLAGAQLYRRPGEIGQFQEQEQKKILEQVTVEQRLNTQVPLDLTFRDETGKTVRLGDYFGKRPVILVMAYYECPMLCTVVLNELTRSLNALDYTIGKEFEVITVSISPTETPELARQKKQTYLSAYKKSGGEKGWHFLVGDEPNIKALANAVGFQYTYDPRTKQYAHPAVIMILTPQGKLARYLMGIEFSARDLKFALTEASEGKIGNPVLSTVLYCFQYDPSTGKYGLVILRVIQVAGIITVLSLAILIGGALLLERRRPNQTPTENEQE
ncbi:MAG: SCO family protein [Armatimonadetes bacterium]|nr:SCO family protein [Armatimonadota bacterium]